MENRIRWINQQGTKILLTDYSGLNTKEIFNLMEKAIPYFENQPPKSVLTLVDLTNTYIVGNLFKKGKEATAKTEQYIKKTAGVGMSKSKQILGNLLARVSKMETKLFSTREEAIKWLLN